MTETTSTGKQPYTTPRLRKVELATDEVLSAGCKTTTSNPQTAKVGQTTCTNPINPCEASGS